MPRTIAIGDIHGCCTALRAILQAIAPQAGDQVIVLGDFVDRGADSRGVIETLIELAAQCRLVPLLGNHEEMMMQARNSDAAYRRWLKHGGVETLESYGPSGGLARVPAEHFEFLAASRDWFETDSHIFVHANYDPEVALELQDAQVLRWRSLVESTPGPHRSGKIAVVGHTPQSSVLNLGHLICLDTSCVYGGQLTAMDLESGQIWQARAT